MFVRLTDIMPSYVLCCYNMNMKMRIPISCVHVQLPVNNEVFDEEHAKELSELAQTLVRMAAAHPKTVAAGVVNLLTCLQLVCLACSSRACLCVWRRFRWQCTCV